MAGEGRTNLSTHVFASATGGADLTPSDSVANYDYSLESLPQFSGLGINTGKYSTNTAEALDSVALQLTSPTRRTKYTKGALDSTEMGHGCLLANLKFQLFTGLYLR